VFACPRYLALRVPRKSLPPIRLDFNTRRVASGLPDPTRHHHLSTGSLCFSSTSSFGLPVLRMTSMPVETALHSPHLARSPRFADSLETMWTRRDCPSHIFTLRISVVRFTTPWLCLHPSHAPIRLADASGLWRERDQDRKRGEVE
jgi:hypothetical protein